MAPDPCGAPTNLVAVYTTVATLQDAERIARALVERASAQYAAWVEQGSRAA